MAYLGHVQPPNTTLPLYCTWKYLSPIILAIINYMHLFSSYCYKLRRTCCVSVNTSIIGCEHANSIKMRLGRYPSLCRLADIRPVYRFHGHEYTQMLSLPSTTTDTKVAKTNVSNPHNNVALPSAKTPPNRATFAAIVLHQRQLVAETLSLYTDFQLPVTTSPSIPIFSTSSTAAEQLFTAITAITAHDQTINQSPNVASPLIQHPVQSSPNLLPQ